MNPEKQRLESRKENAPWKRWGPYLTERQWGTVREDYSPYGTAWEYVTHDQARSKAYRWGEEGIGGISDDQQRLCFSVALWNGRDPILKERLFGVTGSEGNHGEDVKEYYYYLDNTPTHSYMKMLYKYPQTTFPYGQLIEENQRRSKKDPEFELIDTGVFEEDRYFDVFIEYAKTSPVDILIRITAHNRSAETSVLHLLPHIWFRNTWAWGYDTYRPSLKKDGKHTIAVNHRDVEIKNLFCEPKADLVFCENDTNTRRLYGSEDAGFFKDGINDFVVKGDADSVNPKGGGTRAAAYYVLEIPAGSSETVHLRLCKHKPAKPFENAAEMFSTRIAEADAFYEELQTDISDRDTRLVQRQALAGMLWTKQFYYFDIPQWLNGDPNQPQPPKSRFNGRNRDWIHLNNADVISMPDKWEYPWYAAWDLAFHCLPLALIDPGFAKDQLLLFTREWYMHPNGQLPAYEWEFGDVNPPVHAWATWRVYKIDAKQNHGKGDREFLERMFHKLLLNFTWWVNRKDAGGKNIFQGGFLGLDNIGIFDRSKDLPTGGRIEQSDGTSWMAMYCLNMMRIALELSRDNPIYQDSATKFFEHFLYIAGAMTNIGGEGINLWDEEDEFYYDVLHTPDNRHITMKIRSIVGLIPLFAVEILEPESLKCVPEFRERLEWFLNYRPDLASLVSRWKVPGAGDRTLLSLLRGHRMKRLLKRMLDETEFLSDYGIRALSRHHKDHPYEMRVNGELFSVSYLPAESDSGLFGGNSNWRGPIWFPVNYLIIESLQRFYRYYEDDFKIEYPTGSGSFYTIQYIANELSKRLMRIFLRNEDGRRPLFGENEKFQLDPHFRDYLFFYEYFHGDNGRGVGASHQTGWTALIAKLIQPRRS